MARDNSAARLPDESDRAPGTVRGMLPSFAAVYGQYFNFVWSSVRRLGVAPESTDDVVQEIFIVIHARLHTLEQPEALRSWIYGIVRRTVSTHRRAKRTRDALGATLAVETQSHGPAQPTPLELTEQTDALAVLMTVLDELDATKREVFELVELEELTVPEVAQTLQIPLNTAYSRLRAARQAFEAALARRLAREKGR